MMVRCIAMPFAFIVVACSHHADPGISREKAEAVLKAFDYTDIALQAAPNGWLGMAVAASGGYRLRVTVDRNGLRQFRPAAAVARMPVGAGVHGRHRLLNYNQITNASSTNCGTSGFIGNTAG
jgi:hypothetical protein